MSALPGTRRPRRALMLATMAVVAAALAVSGASPTAAHTSTTGHAHNGQIAFARQASDDPDAGHITYVVDPHGAHLRPVANPGDFPRWSPNSRLLALGDMPCEFQATCAAVLVTVATRETNTLPVPAPGLFDQFFGCTVWSPDGKRLACGGLSSSPGTSGVYTVRADNGGDLRKVLACSNECGPADYSPDGRQLVLIGNDSQGLTQLFTVGLDGRGLRQITHSDIPVDGDSAASWSPTGDHLLFSRQPDELHRRAIFEVNADGTDLHQLPIPGCGGAFDAENSIGCFGPSWLPDGKKLTFGHNDAATGAQNIYTAHADGDHPRPVTRDMSGLGVTTPDWGSRPRHTRH